MNDALTQTVALIRKFLGWFTDIVIAIWQWSVGNMISVFQLPFPSLPLWKQVVYVLVVVAMLWVLFRLALQLFDSTMRILRAIVDLFRAIILEIPDVIIVGVIAFFGAWLITSPSVDRMIAGLY